MRSDALRICSYVSLASDDWIYDDGLDGLLCHGVGIVGFDALLFVVLLRVLFEQSALVAVEWSSDDDLSFVWIFVFDRWCYSDVGLGDYGSAFVFAKVARASHLDNDVNSEGDAGHRNEQGEEVVELVHACNLCSAYAKTGDGVGCLRRS